MKEGTRVRFLNAVGGGIVKRIKNKDIVIVEEDDGFETPVLIRECIAVDGNDSRSSSTVAAAPVIPVQSEEKYEVIETSGGDGLNVFLAYIPADIRQLGKCNYEAYFINDSNYFLFFNYMNRKDDAWTSRYTATVEPNTRLFIEEFAAEEVNDLETVCVQFVAFKKDKPFTVKNAYSVELRIDIVKFYKFHCFTENEFLEDKALIYPVVENDAPYRKLIVPAEDIREAMLRKNDAGRITTRPKSDKKDKLPQIIEVDLHINQLLDTTCGMNNKDMLECQLDAVRRTMEDNRTRKGQKIVFIHGKGEGVLRTAVLDELKRKYRQCTVQDASFREYGFGATMVTVR
ncbi:MAG: DUF2027 domain-containing protein [Dysgonamonadaceae bacterium]|jgi:hypothetical protein|nr:DUF2027 domain-containing protein [Dysgonamonadaceae bacterium]